MSELKIIRTGYYDKVGKKADENDFTYITFNIGKDANPVDGDLFVQFSKIKGAPVIIAEYGDNEFGGNFGRPWDLPTIEEAGEKFESLKELIPELKEIGVSKGIDWI
ncbi:hypothetical protein Maeo_1429 [Methanococcus aeolicus Nankai-3]|uniref:Uncharacterized protein n=1 Tax=Methanococcus aeolicus (strain ATCC BAA-1280 / DSM 17508 / OCM 812 / Nankai-3) TaxID=419665 RepID=A6UWY3_META3|nr:hypothetical protein [Methanococcus aeolicus]ABR57005.1 hypothetical protein Maeo_1429 [Methanococcus aeolicus Nankai-3]